VGDAAQTPSARGLRPCGAPGVREQGIRVRGAASSTLGLMSDEAREQTVLLAERALHAAMLASDVDELDRLLHPELLAVGPAGR
jgi:hypothetical protein